MSRAHLGAHLAAGKTQQHRLEGKIALVTGATGSIGSCVARFLADDGLRIVCVDQDESACRQLAAALPTESFGISFDVSDPSAVAAGCARVAKAFGNVDVLINIAGILSNNKVEETTAEEWRKVMAVNLDGVFYLTQAVVPHMKAQVGRPHLAAAVAAHSRSSPRVLPAPRSISPRTVHWLRRVAVVPAPP